MKNKLFISISGMSGSGKSYLLDKFQNWIDDFCLIDENNEEIKIGIINEGARKLLSTKHKKLDLSKYKASTYDKLSTKDKKSYEKWQSDLCQEFKNELKKHKDCDIIISDRSTFDQQVYYEMQCGKEGKCQNNIVELDRQLNTCYKVVYLLTDTPLTKIINNFENDPKHHYTTDMSYLFLEKLKFMQTAKNHMHNNYFCIISPMDEKFDPKELLSTILRTYMEINK